MKKIFFFAATCLAFAACSNESLVDDNFGGQRDGAIKFVMNQKNMTRAYTDMQNTGHYNFGVFGYKITDKDNAVMNNYLVGYYDENNAYLKSGSTWGDGEGREDGLSYWMYEGMGYSEYNGTYAGQELTAAFKSNNPNQYLKFWDNAAASTCFYAYAPYINNSVKPTADYVDGTAKSPSADKFVLTFPNGTLTEGYDDVQLSEYMYAATKVANANYGLDVPLQFHRLNAKVNIKFWEDIKGYKVRILDLGGSGNYEGVQAAASIKDGTSGTYGYKGGTYYHSNGVKIQFKDNDAEVLGKKQYEGEIYTNAKPLIFQSPTVAAIGETRLDAAASPTTYYAIPKGDGANVMENSSTDYTSAVAPNADLALTGFTFHVTYELTAEDTGERIIVNNATVHVPYTYCNWKDNTHYTYIFKITKNSNGTTTPDVDPTNPNNPTIDPTNPEVPEVQALYPIVFDNCTVVDWDEDESEWVISDEAERAYHDVQLSTYSIANSGNITVTVTDNDKWLGHEIDYSKVTVTGPDANANTWYTAGTGNGTIAVPAGAAPGVYTVTYECTGAPVTTTHPAKWSETFFVGNAYNIATNLNAIGTNAAANAALNITATKDGSSVTPAADQLYIEYPTNFTAAEKALVKVSDDRTKIEVSKNAKPGEYRLVYKVDEGTSVKVAERIFNVVDYSFALSHTIVFNKVGGNTVKGNQPATLGEYKSADFTVAGNEIDVPNGTVEGTYTITFTVNGGTDAETVYSQTFKVVNTHAVTLSKSVIQSQLSWDGNTAFGADYLYIAPTFNGLAVGDDQASALTVETENGADATSNFTIAWDDTESKYKLQVKPNTTAAKYYVVYTKTVGGVSTKQKAELVVKK